MRAKRSAAAIALLCLLTACGGGGEDLNTLRLLEFTVLDSSADGQIRSPRFTTVRNDAEWQSLWTEFKGALGSPAAPPPVNFQSTMVVGLFVGSRPSGCFTADIRRVIQEASTIRVEYTDGGLPGPQFCTQGFVYPSVLAAIGRSDLPVTFLKVDQ